MKRREATPEQKEAAEKRRAKMRELTGIVAAMSPEERAEWAQRVPVVTCKAHMLSVFNNCLIASQLPSATIVGGFRQWQEEGRTVKKGEKGLALWVPLGKGREDGAPLALADAGQETGGCDAEGNRRGFILGTVFDISQTKPLDSLDVDEAAEPALANEAGQLLLTA